MNHEQGRVVTGRASEELLTDAAARELLSAVPRLAPSRGFARRVMAATASARRPAVEGIFDSQLARGVMASLGVTVGLTAVLVALVTAALAAWFPSVLGDAIGLGVRAGLWIGWALSVLGFVAGIAADVAKALALAAGTPTAGAAALACAAVAAMSLWSLSRLLVPREEMR